MHRRSCWEAWEFEDHGRGGSSCEALGGVWSEKNFGSGDLINAIRCKGRGKIG